MSCRTTPAGSAFTSYARLANNSHLSDVATLSTFHYLRSLYQSRGEDARRTYTEGDYRELLGRQIERTRRLTHIPEARRNSIIARLEEAQNSPTVPDQSTLYALFNLNPTVRDRGRGLQAYLQEYARVISCTSEEAQARWRELEDGIDRSRSAAAPATFTEENKALAAQRSLPRDPGSVHAMATMDDDMASARLRRFTESTQRITRTPVDVSTPSGYSITEHGYDPRSNRLEVVVLVDGREETWAYRDISQEEYNQHVANETLGQWWENNIHGNPSYSYETPLAAAEAGVAPRCAVCGQFADATHDCPVLPEATEFSVYDGRWTRQRVSVPPIAMEDGFIPDSNLEMAISLPGAMRIREAFSRGPVRVPINAWHSQYLHNQESGERRWEHIRLAGNIMAYRTPEGQMAFNTANMRCSCTSFENTGRCAHIDGAALAMRTRLIPPTRTPSRRLTPEERAERIAEAQRLSELAAQSDWTRNEETLAEARRTWRSQAEIRYSEDTDGFVERYNAAAEAARNADTPQISYLRENALDGLAERGRGRAFGVEIEYDFPPSMSWPERRAANDQIARELHELGLSREPYQQGYGVSRRLGFRDTHQDSSGASNWSLERDGSVGGGELVTPAMYDEPETWEKLEKAVAVLTRHGAVSSRKAGAHIHVGTASYRGDGKKYSELARLMTQHEDVMMRLAADPNRGSHRNNSYSTPLASVPTDGFSDVTQAKRWQGSRSRNLNLMSVSSNEAESQKDHVEFRIFDSSLHAGTIQTQIKVAVAMTAAAERIAEDAPTARGKELLGSHAQRATARGRRRLTHEDIIEETATFRSLLDTLFSRKADKDQAVELFAHNKWTKKRR